MKKQTTAKAISHALRASGAQSAQIRHFHLVREGYTLRTLTSGFPERKSFSINIINSNMNANLSGWVEELRRLAAVLQEADIPCKVITPSSGFECPQIWVGGNA